MQGLHCLTFSPFFSFTDGKLNGLVMADIERAIDKVRHFQDLPPKPKVAFAENSAPPPPKPAPKDSKPASPKKQNQVSKSEVLSSSTKSQVSLSLITYNLKFSK